ncbi:MAG: hypothetical protein R3C20_14550 [Planctomycetaceae bacterium]
MLNLLKQLRRDEYGVILSTEIVIVGSVLVIGLITGLSCLQKSVNAELRDLGNAVGSLDQSYSFAGHYKPPTNGKCCAWTAGSSFHNCEEKDKCHGDIVGGACCETAVISTGCSTCEACGGAGCGSCSSAPCGGCGTVGCHGSCGSGQVGSGAGKARCIDAGVPKMKVSEWPSARTHSHSAPLPNGSLIPVPEGTPGFGVHSEVISHSGVVHEAVLSGECCSQTVPLPAHSGDINIPDHVW